MRKAPRPPPPSAASHCINSVNLTCLRPGFVARCTFVSLFFLQPAETRCVLPAPAWPTLVPSHGCQARARKEPKSLFRRQRCATSTPPARLRTTTLDHPPSLIRTPSRSKSGSHSLCAGPERCPNTLPQRKRLLHETFARHRGIHPVRSLILRRRPRLDQNGFKIGVVHTRYLQETRAVTPFPFRTDPEPAKPIYRRHIHR